MVAALEEDAVMDAGAVENVEVSRNRRKRTMKTKMKR